MSTIKVDTIATRTGSGNITASTTIVGNITGNVTGNQSGGSVTATTISATTSGTPLTVNSTNSNNNKIVFQNNGTTVSHLGGLSNGLIFSNAAGTQIGRFDADGLKFGTDSGANNGLDDYEIGSYSPSYYGSSGAGSQSYSHRHGSYVKIGNLCQVWIDITLSAASGASGNANMTLPFTSANAAPLQDSVSQNMGNWWFWDMNSNYTSGSTPSAWIPQNVNYAHMYKTNGAAGGHSNLNYNTTGRIACSVIYFTA